VRISEIFSSVQGEGFLTGTPSVFVRTTGCNLRCWFCDTPYTSWQAEGEPWTTDEVIARVVECEEAHVVLTGGEPLVQHDCVAVCAELREAGRHVTVETAGTVFQPLECDLMSISPKLSSSAPSSPPHTTWRRRHEQRRHRPSVIARLIDCAAEYQIKFVVDRPADVDEVERYLDEMPDIDRQRVLLMPQGVDLEQLERKGRWLEVVCQERGLQFCPRMQIEWYGLARAT